MIEFGIHYTFIYIFSIALINFILVSVYSPHIMSKYPFATVTTVTCNPGENVTKMTGAYFLTRLKIVPPEIVWIVVLMGPF